MDVFIGTLPTERAFHSAGDAGKCCFGVVIDAVIVFKQAGVTRNCGKDACCVFARQYKSRLQVFGIHFQNGQIFRLFLKGGKLGEILQNPAHENAVVKLDIVCCQVDVVKLPFLFHEGGEERLFFVVNIINLFF